MKVYLLKPILVSSLVLLSTFSVGSSGNLNNNNNSISTTEIITTSEKKPEIIKASTTIVIKKYNSSEKQEIIKKIANTFPENPALMVAIAMQESTLNPKAKSYNCYYEGYWTKGASKPTITNNTPLKTKTKNSVSWFCKKGDEPFAWSMDGGLFQIHNAKSEDFNIDTNLKKAREKYDIQGLNAWSAYYLNHYKKYMQLANKMISEIEK